VGGSSNFSTAASESSHRGFSTSASIANGGCSSSSDPIILDLSFANSMTVIKASSKLSAEGSYGRVHNTHMEWIAHDSVLLEEIATTIK
jgi:hypothetical protein